MNSEIRAQDLHDPKGKVRTRLLPGVSGDAEFSECGRYRRSLRRWSGDAFPERFMLYIGMNPSTADAEVNDPTISREWGFTTREGFAGLVKRNVGDYRATKPKDLLVEGVIPCSAGNIDAIVHDAQRAAIVVLAHGILKGGLADTGTELHRRLSSAGVTAYCFGVTKDGVPRHPLYVKSDAPLVPFVIA